MGGIMPGVGIHTMKKQEAYTQGNIKVTEHKVAKEVVEPEPEPKRVEMGQRFHKGHRIQYSKDTFCYMKCLNCGIIGRTYLIPFEEPCEKQQAHEYDYGD